MGVRHYAQQIRNVNFEDVQDIVDGINATEVLHLSDVIMENIRGIWVNIRGIWIATVSKIGFTFK